MSTLQLGLIVAGVLLVIGVIVYNPWQERRLKRAGARPLHPPMCEPPARRERVEPTLGAADRAADCERRHRGVSTATPISKVRSSRPSMSLRRPPNSSTTRRPPMTRSRSP